MQVEAEFSFKFSTLLFTNLDATDGKKCLVQIFVSCRSPRGIPVDVVLELCPSNTGTFFRSYMKPVKKLGETGFKSVTGFNSKSVLSQ